MKILITGSNGMLGSSLQKELKNYELINTTSKTLDITNRDEVQRFIKDSKPDVVIHAAAQTNVELAEKEKDRNYLVNTIGTHYLVEACQDAMFIYISSTGNYGNKKSEPYIEFDEVNPTTEFHKAKFEGEKIVQNHLKKYLILRTGWLFGGEKNHAKNFVYKRYLEMRDKDVIYSDISQKGSPTSTKNFAKQIDYLIQNRFIGVYNCVDRGIATRYEYVQKIAECFNLNCKILPTHSFTRIAPVSKNESAINYKLELMGANAMQQSWEDSLKDYIEELKNNG